MFEYASSCCCLLPWKKPKQLQLKVTTKREQIMFYTWEGYEISEFGLLLGKLHILAFSAEGQSGAKLWLSCSSLVRAQLPGSRQPRSCRLGSQSAGASSAHQGSCTSAGSWSCPPGSCAASEAEAGSQLPAPGTPSARWAGS